MQFFLNQVIKSKFMGIFKSMSFLFCIDLLPNMVMSVIKVAYLEICDHELISH